MGAGNYYLAPNTFQGLGTNNIDPALLAELAQRTTCPPVWLTNTFTSNTNLNPQAPRDTNSSPDLGYHYDPIDFLSSCSMSPTPLLTLTNGVALAYYNKAGITLQYGANLFPRHPQPTQVIGYNELVQEQSTDLWGAWAGLRSFRSIANRLL